MLEFNVTKIRLRPYLLTYYLDITMGNKVGPTTAICIARQTQFNACNSTDRYKLHYLINVINSVRKWILYYGNKFVEVIRIATFSSLISGNGKYTILMTLFDRFASPLISTVLSRLDDTLMCVQWALGNTANTTHTPLPISANWLITINNSNSNNEFQCSASTLQTWRHNPSHTHIIVYLLNNHEPVSHLNIPDLDTDPCCSFAAYLSFSSETRQESTMYPVKNGERERERLRLILSSLQFVVMLLAKWQAYEYKYIVF